MKTLRQIALTSLILMASLSHAQGLNYYVDCLKGGDLNPGTFDSPWRRPLQVTLHDTSPGFFADDHIYFHTDCTWNSGLKIASSGTSGHPIVIDAYGGTAPFSGTPPRLTGQLPIPSTNWAVFSGNVWKTTLYTVAAGGSSLCTADVTCVKCYQNLACIDQAIKQMNMVRFGVVWGNNRGSLGALAQDRDWYFDTNNPATCLSAGCTQVLYVYSSGGNPTSTFGQVFPIAVGGEDIPVNGGEIMLNLIAPQWLQIQHLLLDWYDSNGVIVSGGADHIWLANIAANSMVENGTIVGGLQYSQTGFFIEPSGTPTDIHLYNVDANMNYIGYIFGTSLLPCVGCQYELKNCRAYGNRLFGLKADISGGGVLDHDYCHFYANNLGIAIGNVTATTSAMDIGADGGYTAPTLAAHDIAFLTPPWIRQWKRWPAYTNVGYDDPGLVKYSAEYFESLRPIYTSQGIIPSIATVTGQTYSGGGPVGSIPGTPNLLSTNPNTGNTIIQSWINAGLDVVSHSVSHGYWSPPAYTGLQPGACSDNPGGVPCDVFKIQYTGSIATSVTMTVTHSGGGGALTITSSPNDPQANVTWDLTPVLPGGTPGPTQIDTVSNAIVALRNRGVFTLDTTAYNNAATKGASHMYGLANVTTQDIRTSQYSILYDEQFFQKDEFNWAQQWLNANTTGLPVTRVAVMPFLFLDPTTEAIISGLGYKGIRGRGSLQPCCANITTLANGYDVNNILSQGAVPNLTNLSTAQMRAYVFNDTWKNQAWGRPLGYFHHIGEMRPEEDENLIQGLKDAGATLVTLTNITDLLLSCNSNSVLPAPVSPSTPPYVAGSFKNCPNLAFGNLIGALNGESLITNGTGYQVGDILTLVQAGASGGTFRVVTVAAGNQIASIALACPFSCAGQGYLASSHPGLGPGLAPWLPPAA